MANLKERAGGVPIRLGGNTQEFAVMVDHLPNGRTFGKEDSGTIATVWSKSQFLSSFNDLFFSDKNSCRHLHARYVLYVFQHFIHDQREMVLRNSFQRFSELAPHHR